MKIRTDVQFVANFVERSKNTSFIKNPTWKALKIHDRQVRNLLIYCQYKIYSWLKSDILIHQIQKILNNILKDTMKRAG